MLWKRPLSALTPSTGSTPELCQCPMSALEPTIGSQSPSAARTFSGRPDSCRWLWSPTRTPYSFASDAMCTRRLWSGPTSICTISMPRSRQNVSSLRHSSSPPAPVTPYETTLTGALARYSFSRPLHAAAEALAGIRLDVRVAEASGRLDRLDERAVAERVRLEREPQVGGKRGKRSRERKTENKSFHFIGPFVSVPQNMRYTFEM